MTLVDSVDSILMLYSYSGFPECSFTIFSPKLECKASAAGVPPGTDNSSAKEKENLEVIISEATPHEEVNKALPSEDPNSVLARDTRVKMNVMSGLSIILTLMSVLVAFSISLITIMGLIGEQCRPCRKAADAEDGGGLAGRWWRGWRRASDQSGYIGVAIVGGFLTIVSVWCGGRWIRKKVGEGGCINTDRSKSDCSG